MELTKEQINTYINEFEEYDLRKELEDYLAKGYKFLVDENLNYEGWHNLIVKNEQGHEIYDDEITESMLECLKRHQKIFERAKEEYKELKQKIDKYNEKGLSLTFAYSQFDSYGFNDNLFDLNYGCLVATIQWKNNRLELCNSVEVWDDEYGTLLNEDYEVGE